jgi:hypothetical protein
MPAVVAEKNRIAMLFPGSRKKLTGRLKSCSYNLLTFINTPAVATAHPEEIIGWITSNAQPQPASPLKT